MFNNPLALSPRSAPSSLQCVRGAGNRDGECRLQPNNHGDACNVDGECAGRCQKSLRLCEGIVESEACTPGVYPDQCADKHYCAASATTSAGGTCQKTISAGRQCNYANSCDRGYYCAGPSLNDGRRCVQPFTVRNGANTTIGPYMCESANALMVERGPNDVDSVYQCIASNLTLSGTPCDGSTNSTLAGYECKCAADNQNRLRTVGGLGLGTRSAVWKNLYNCMMEVRASQEWWCLLWGKNGGMQGESRA